VAVRVDANNSREIQDLARALSGAERDIQATIRRESKAVIQPAWREELFAEVETTYEAAFADTGRAVISNQNVTLNAAKVRGHRFSGGLDLRESWTQIERGANQALERSYPVAGHSRAGNPVKGYRMNNRKVMAPFRPRMRGGYVAGPATGEVIYRAVRLWIQTAMRTLFDNLEKGR
jgi:hypothetical protein